MVISDNGVWFRHDLHTEKERKKERRNNQLSDEAIRDHQSCYQINQQSMWWIYSPRPMKVLLVAASATFDYANESKSLVLITCNYKPVFVEIRIFFFKKSTTIENNKKNWNVFN